VFLIKEQDSLRSQFVTLKRGQHSKYPPKKKIGYTKERHAKYGKSRRKK
jgi:hypothetical protein